MAEAPDRPRRTYIDGPYGQVHLQHQGAGAPLVLLHQAPMTSGQFDNVYGPLSRRGFLVVGVDLPGFGGSDPSPGTPTIEAYAQVLPAVIASLGGARAVLAGHHTGAMVAAWGAVAWPEMVAGVVLHGVLLATPAERDGFLGGWHLAERRLEAEPDGSHLLRVFRGRARLAAGSVSPARLTDYVVQAFSGQGAYWHGHHAAYTHDFAQTLIRLNRPAMLMSNTGDMLHEHFERAHTLRPDLPTHVLEGGGVDIMDQAPEAWADVVARFAISLRLPTR